MASPRSHRQPVALVVDDDDYVHEALVSSLRSLGVQAVGAHLGAEALELARSHRPDLAIVDVGLPDTDGYSLTRALRAEGSLPNLRILILTGHLPDLVQAAAAGADEVLGKPFRLTQFLPVVRRLLDNGA